MILMMKICIDEILQQGVVFEWVFQYIDLNGYLEVWEIVVVFME